MKKQVLHPIFLLLISLTLSGCSPIGQKTASISIIYCVAAVLSLLLLISYCCVMRKKEIWFLLLFASVFVVNTGYFTLSISQSLEEALLANRIAYLGSVFLPMAMLMIIFHVTGIKFPKWLSGLLLAIAVIVFLVAASPGYWDIYYKDVSFEIVNGVSMLNKVYGSWHCLYLFYLLIYFGVMITLVIFSAVKKKMDAPVHAVILIIAVFVNLGVWLIEQLVKIDFEVLSLSYIISELFLLGLHVAMQENERLKGMIAKQSFADNPSGGDETCHCAEDVCKNNPAMTATEAPAKTPEIADAQFAQYLSGLPELTRTERKIYDFYISGATTKEIMAALSITENTLKFHNKNLYGKLGVSSRKQLVEIHRQLNDAKSISIE